jgi:hypothetical protein
MSYVAIAIAALSGLSWAIGRQIAPATYAARAAISAEAPGGTATAEQLAEWQRYHDTLLKDPALTDTAAERMGRRGIVSLAKPGALMSRLNEDLSSQSPADGQMIIELRGHGAGETVRVLDTYVTALVSQSNADRERRTDGLSTAITAAASAGGGPIEDQRVAYSMIVFVLLSSLSVGGGKLVCNRIAKAKERFEREHADGDNPSEWQRPPQDYART